jgi:DNA-binding CsgD family transcriptional regulator/tetratricopeptide (TPR) repeat protein
MRLGLGDALSAADLVPQLVAVRHLLGAGLDERTRLLREGLDLIAEHAGERAQEIRAGLHAALAAAYMLDRRLEEATEVGVLAEAFSVEDCDHPLRCHLGGTLGSILVFGGRMDEGWQMLANAIGRARRGGLEAEAARGYRMLGSSASVLVEYDRARRWLAEGIAYAESVERFNDRHYMAAHLAHVDWAEGSWEAAETGATRALADGQGITTRITALHVLGYVALGRARWEVAAECMREAAALGEAMGELQRVSPAWWGLASIALLRGEAGEAIGWCERGYRASAKVRDAAYLFPYVVTGVRAYLATQDLTGARDWLARTAALLGDREIPGTLGAIDHGAGLVHLHEGQTGKARAELERAASFWRGRRRFWEGTQAVSDQARCANRSRRPADAGRLSAQVAAQAEAVGAVVLMPVASGQSSWAAPGPLSAASGSPSGLPQLTAREVEVAGLIGEGATNREIAAALSISPKTVSAHVEHILTKLAASRRAQIATWAATHSRRLSTDRGTSNGL